MTLYFAYSGEFHHFFACSMLGNSTAVSRRTGHSPSITSEIPAAHQEAAPVFLHDRRHRRDVGFEVFDVVDRERGNEIDGHP